MQTLQTVLDLATAERDRAQAALRRAEDLAGRHQQQLEQLDVYRGEYQRRWAGQFSRQGAIEIVHCYQSFMERLDEAVVQQSNQVQAARGAAERARTALLGCEMRVASVRKLMERRAAEQQLASQRREQRQADESAQQASWRAAQAASLTTTH